MKPIELSQAQLELVIDYLTAMRYVAHREYGHLPFEEYFDQVLVELLLKEQLKRNV